MKKQLLATLMILAVPAIAGAQSGAAPSTDVLGAHLNYGRGCAACHAPHSGAAGNGKSTTDATTGNWALWGEDVGGLFGQTILTGGGGYSETLPSSMAMTTQVPTGTTYVGTQTTKQSPDVAGLLTCLSCHDGNLATGAMMLNAVYEKLPGTYGKTAPPTLLGNDGTGAGNYLNDHPVGMNAVMGCGGQYNWDCTISNGKVLMTGPNSSRFVQNYGFFVKPGIGISAAGGLQPVVVCTTCHNQHLMNVVSVTNGATSGLATGYYATMFFILAPYNPGDTNTATNQTAQFCRQCHGGEANESNNGTAGTVF